MSPLVEELKRTSDRIEGDARADELRTTQAGLLDAGMRLKSLADKIAGQQAYLLIFGPLKSGKSTLMNAISGTYVSEVTSLPAYPCLVYVRHGAKAFTVTNYDGKEASFDDAQSLETAIADGHTCLAEKIREKEQSGETFDPGVDYPEAIRRVDIRVPINDLVESSTVMVDTPGLYSRMKFGYDLMTREFRDSAACAVFVVKTDNLYLEQVFAEFNDLLDLFSRIFLVVNIDGSKRDLRPDGSLQPSLESQNPERIIDAFETLAMDAQLKDALDDGRLRIYPIDLLNAAANHLQSAAGEDTDENEGTFQAFRSDLTEYLNSNEYFLAFMRDSLRQGATICRETRGHCGPESLEIFARNQESLASEVAVTEGKLAAVEKFNAIDHGKAFQLRREECEAKGSKVVESFDRTLPNAVEEAVSRWSESDDSLQALFQNYCAPLVQELAARVDEDSARYVQGLVGTQSGGADFSLEALEAIETLGISLPDVGKSAGAGSRDTQRRDLGGFDIQIDSIPVKRSFIDWLLFRKQEVVRRKLLGEDGDLTQSISASAKRRRLGEEGFEAIRQLCLAGLRQVQAGIPVDSAAHAMRGYSTSYAAELDRRMESLRSEQAAELQRLQTRIDSDAQITKALEGLRKVSDTMEERISELEERFHCGEAVGEEDDGEGAPKEKLLNASSLLGSIAS